MTESPQAQSDLHEQGRKLFAGPCDFVLGVAKLDQLPEADRGEVAFVGRSNVGKSSLINALTNRKILARVSHTPGRTQQLNFFDLGRRIFLVDMPGYGYAKVSKKMKEEWNGLIRLYLTGRPTIRCVFVLVDARHGLKDSDIEIMKLLDQSAVAYRITLTKADKVKKTELEKLIENIKSALKKHAAAFSEVHVTSAHKNTGLDELRAIIAGFSS